MLAKQELCECGLDYSRPGEQILINFGKLVALWYAAAVSKRNFRLRSTMSSLNMS